MSESTERILALISEKGITAYKLAKETGIGQATISSWKSGNTNPSYGALVKIADYLGVSVDYLEGKTDNPHPDKDQGDVLDVVREAFRNSEYGDLIMKMTPEQRKEFAHILVDIAVDNKKSVDAIARAKGLLPAEED